MATFSACTGTTNVATVPPITGGTGQNVHHALYISNDYASSGDTVAQCQTVRIGPDGLQN